MYPKICRPGARLNEATFPPPPMYPSIFIKSLIETRRVFSSPPSSPQPTGNQKLISATKYLPQDTWKEGREDIGAVPPPTIAATEEAQSNAIGYMKRKKEKKNTPIYIYMRLRSKDGE
ncbi:hypothetical protein NPIL_89261, partial [Nephila pilipes]